MIQAVCNDGTDIDNYIYLRTTDVSTSTVSNVIRPLISIKSQQTEKILNFIPILLVLTNEERYTEMKYRIGSFDLPVIGLIKLGNTDFPFGFYDVTIYQNSTNSNLDPSGLSTKLYTGLLNLRPVVDTTQYKQYTINDSDTDSVYITL